MKKIILVALAVLFSASVFAETIHLKSGKTVEGKIIEKNEDFIKIETLGVVLTYYHEDILSIQKEEKDTETNNYAEKTGTIINQSDYAKAVNFYTKSIKDNPNAMKEQGSTGQGLLGLVAMTNLEDLNSESLQLRARMFSAIGKTEEALSSMNRAIELAPNDCNYYLERAFIYLNMDKPAESQQDIQKSRELGCDISPELLKSLGKKSYSMKDSEQIHP
ncbi:MAG: hypothetical protein GY858_08960 [Candidatus Omnitrophica bacterium]|nr:hypothetical protein [Candidatus Omnitrophota bacterium]